MQRLAEVPMPSGPAPSFDIVFHAGSGRPTVDNAGLVVSSVMDGPRALVQFDWFHDQFDRAAVEQMCGHYRSILERALPNPAQRVDSIDLLTPEERRTVLVDFNATRSPYPRDAGIHELVEEQAARFPHHPAVVRGGDVVSYRELSQRSDRVARLLERNGVRAGQLVGCAIGRFPAFAIAALGTLKAGAAYLPIDPDYPRERVRQLVRDGGVSTVLTSGATTERPAWSGLARSIDVDGAAEAVGDAPVVGHRTNVDDLAYVMYTSGSTGQPKGVLLTHRNVVRLVKNTNVAPLSHRTRVLQTGAVVFDASTFELWGTLLNGGTLYQADDATLLDPSALRQTFARHSINTLWLTAPLFARLADADPELFSCLEYLLVGGDVVSPRHVAMVRRRCPSVHLVNGYGPTENTTFSTTHLIGDDDTERIPIGRPIANSTAYILNDELQPQPIGVPGELFVGGDGLARGYLDQPELTARRFPPHPFVAGERLYRTGDLARWRPDGTIDFLGRRDDQVKVRGYRVEPQEVEQALLEHRAVREAVVLARPSTDGDGKQLCAYYSVRSDVDERTVRDHLVARLPAFMIPSSFIRMQALPVNPNGKIDRGALLPPDGTGHGDRPRVSVEGDLEHRLVALWRQVTGTDEIGTQDRFFDVGGSSLAAITVATLARRRYAMDVPVAAVLQNPTVGELAAAVRGAPVDRAGTSTVDTAGSVPPSPPDGAVPTSYLQELQLVLGEDANPSWPVVQFFRLSGHVDPGALADSLTAALNRHEALRMRFPQRHRPSFAFITDDGQWPLTRYDGQAVSAAARANLLRSFAASFELSTGPLVDGLLVQDSATEWVLGLAVDHMVFDEVSAGLLAADISAGYRAAVTGVPAALEAPVPFASAVRAERDFYARPEAARVFQHWADEFVRRGELQPCLTLRTDLVEASDAIGAARAPHRDLDPADLHRLERFARRHNTTLFTVLLSAFLVSLRRLSTGSVVGARIPVHGRRWDGADRSIGPFSPSLPLWLALEPNEGVADVLDRVRLAAAGLVENAMPIPAMAARFGTVAGVPLRSHAALRSALLVPHALFLGNLEELPTPDLAGASVQRLRVERPAAAASPMIVLRVDRRDRGLTVSLVFAGTVYRADLGGLLLREMMAELAVLQP